MLSPQEELNIAMRLAERLKASGGNPGLPPTGPNSLFNTPGLEPGIATT